MSTKQSILDYNNSNKQITIYRISINKRIYKDIEQSEELITFRMASAKYYKILLVMGIYQQVKKTSKLEYFEKKKIVLFIEKKVSRHI